ncbi:hypothetical protein LCI18_008410 [Fusarium solani-melongenae]|uniref:Uncharacterized protein n=1 Tax=Fusarium solani subsp. cucurbitae TaxID=2747967 RepID=A0ACD3Z8B2_FUSSC|nr:hypothetical protein LCI18_008410 [Fusarium solani-melongenae]
MHYKSLLRPFLSEANARKRLRFARRYVHMAEDFWEKWTFSDEVIIARGEGQRRTRVFCKPHERLFRRNVQTRVQPARHSQMFFSAFNHRRCLPMVPLAGDPESPRGGVTAQVILACLQRYLPRIVTRNSYFQHDNASTFTAHIVRDWIYEWCESRRAEVVDWPPCSPDLNPIENQWAILKERICKRYAELTYMPKTEEAKQTLIAAAIELWEEIEPEVIDNLVHPMKRRMQAVVRAHGWYTKY